MDTPSIRYHVAPIHYPDVSIYPVFDGLESRFVAACEYPSDAELVNAALNTLTTLQSLPLEPARKINPRWRQLMATELCDFRLRLEHDNGGPLVGEPDLAYFLDNLCNFFGFNTGERAMVLGRDLLVLLCRLESEPASELIVV